MVATKGSNIEIGILEKIIVNWALPSDFIYHSIRALATHDTSQTPYERLHAMWNGKIETLENSDCAISLHAKTLCVFGVLEIPDFYDFSME